MVLATEEKALLAFEPTRRIVPTTKTKITASITAYSAMSCPLSSLKIWGRILISLQFLSIVKTRTLGWQAMFGSRTLNLIPLGDCAPAPTIGKVPTSAPKQISKSAVLDFVVVCVID